MTNNKREQILCRRDISNLLFHFTRSPHEKTASLRINIIPPDTITVLMNILLEQRLVGSNGYIRGGHNCICFTETPIGEIPSFLKLNEFYAAGGKKPKYEPYGVAVEKDWLFERGGRPVIYQPDSEYNSLPETMRYRHARYEPAAGVDFTWEREWRLCGNELRLDPKKTIVIVPTSSEAFDMMYSHAEWKANYNRNGTPENPYREPIWMAVSLELFGLPWPEPGRDQS